MTRGGGGGGGGGGGHLWPQEHNLNELGRVSLDDATYQIPNIIVLCLVVSEKKIYSSFPYISRVKHVTQGAGPFLTPG